MKGTDRKFRSAKPIENALSSANKPSLPRPTPVTSFLTPGRIYSGISLNVICLRATDSHIDFNLKKDGTDKSALSVTYGPAVSWTCNRQPLGKDSGMA
ncbi:hypothetical protein TNCV_2469461 [Trichonephila clavipes]|nr:hypothetical protein TNCV_2469461 [Trichonephila clavipes]